MTEAIRPAAQITIASALEKASRSTGVGFDYLYRVALRESSLDPAAKAATSSAAGLFQFIEETWLRAVQKYGAAHSLAAEAGDIRIASNGKPVVADAARRTEILDLRFDPEKAAALAGELARENKIALEGALGRAIDAAELYAAHFLGAGGAKRLLSAKATDSAAGLLPLAAAANRRVFYDGERAKTVAEVVESFRRTIGGAKTAITSAGAQIEKSLAPLLRETAAAFAPERASFGTQKILHPEEGRTPAPQAETPRGFEFKSLSPLILAVLQALDPRDSGGRKNS